VTRLLNCKHRDIFSNIASRNSITGQSIMLESIQSYDINVMFVVS